MQFFVEAPALDVEANAIPMTSRPTQVSSISEYEVDDDVLLYDPRSDDVHVLNGTAAVIWWLCDGDHTPAQIVDELAGMYELLPETVSADVEAALGSFKVAGLVSWIESPN